MKGAKSDGCAKGSESHFFHAVGGGVVRCFSVKRFTLNFASSATTVVRVNCVLVALTGGPPRRSRADKRKTRDRAEDETASIRIAFSHGPRSDDSRNAIYEHPVHG